MSVCAGLLAGQNLIGMPAINTAPLNMARTVASPTNGHALGLNAVAGKHVPTTPSVLSPSPFAERQPFVRMSVTLALLCMIRLLGGRKVAMSPNTTNTGIT